jgi:hypothetical protein
MSESGRNVPDVVLINAPLFAAYFCDRLAKGPQTRRLRFAGGESTSCDRFRLKEAFEEGAEFLEREIPSAKQGSS